MGKFVNKVFTNTVNDLVESRIKRLDNVDFRFNDKSPYVVDFYNLHSSSTLSEGSRLNASSLGPNSPFRFAYIKDALIYISNGRIEFNYDYTEFGVEGAPVEGEAIIIPNTFIPNPNSFFVINHAGKNYIFIVTSIDTDTVDNGHNFYKLTYQLYYIGEDKLELLKKQVVESYEMVSDNIGTEFKCIVRKTDYDLIEKIEPILSDMRNFYKAIFYKERLQTYVYMGDDGKRFYDPYMIEFMIRTGIMNDNGNYAYLKQAMYLPSTFIIDYDDSFFRCFETKNKDKLCQTNAWGKYIEDPNSLFVTRYEDYFCLKYTPEMWFNTFETLDSMYITNIQEDKYYPKSDEDFVYNILTDHFNHPDAVLSADNIEALDNIKYICTRKIFYLIPLLLYSMETAVKNLLYNI